MKPFLFGPERSREVQTRMSDIQEQRLSFIKHVGETTERAYVRLLNPAEPETVYEDGKMYALTDDALVVHSGPSNDIFEMMNDMYARWNRQSDRSPLCYVLHKASSVRLARELFRLCVGNPAHDARRLIMQDELEATIDHARYRNIPVISHSELECRGVLFGEGYKDGEDEYTTHTKPLVEEHDFTKGGRPVGFSSRQGNFFPLDFG